MASANAANANETSVADELGAKPPPNIIIPPKGVRDNVVKTANFVVRRSERDEAQMIARIRDVVKAGQASAIGSVLPEDSYHPYYTWYLQQVREGKGPVNSAPAPAVAEKPKGPPEPAMFRFLARMPHVNAKDLDIMKMTAMYAARLGENWLNELRTRHSGSFQFDFLRANHSYHSYFRSLIGQYKILIEEEETVEARVNDLELTIKNRFHILDRAKGRADYIKFVEQQKEKEQKQAETEKKEYASIDWQDYKGIDSVLFDMSDDSNELGGPVRVNDLQSASLEQKAMLSMNSRRIEEARPDDVTYYNATQQPIAPMPFPPSAYPAMPPVAHPAHPAYGPPPGMPYGYPPPQQMDWQAEETRKAQELQAQRDQAVRAQAAARGAPGSMRIRENYVPGRAKKAHVPTAQCPNCKQMFPTDEIEEHIRIELLDPRWKEQRAKTEARYSTVITPNEAASNLKRFASQRDDIYDGVSGVPISEEEAARRKKAATSYDGQPDPAKDAMRLQQMQSMNVQEQLRRIQERHGGGQ